MITEKTTKEECTNKNYLNDNYQLHLLTASLFTYDGFVFFQAHSSLSISFVASHEFQGREFAAVLVFAGAVRVAGTVPTFATAQRFGFYLMK